MRDKVVIKAYGKINLGLDVIRRREDGYHEVKMIMQNVSLHDRVTVSRTSEPGIVISSDRKYVPCDSSNLAWKAAKLLMDEFNITDGVRIHIEKRIPVAAGMAGGSTDGAAALVGVNKIFGLGLGKRELMKRGVKLGADVPYCILGGTALSEGIGEVLTPIPPMMKCPVLIVKPEASVSTAWVYKNLNLPGLTEKDHPDIEAVRKAIEDRDLKSVCDNLGNILETVTIPGYPVIGEIKELLKEEGAKGVLMSGSGPTVFALFDNEKMVQKAYETMRFGRGRGLAKDIHITGFHNLED